LEYNLAGFSLLFDVLVFEEKLKPRKLSALKFISRLSSYTQQGNKLNFFNEEGGQ